MVSAELEDELDAYGASAGADFREVLASLKRTT